MLRLIAAEGHKLVTTRLWLWLLLAAMALTVLFASLAIIFAADPDNPTPRLSSLAGQHTVFAVGGGAGAVAAVLGAIGITGEFRHNTASATFLAAPRRGRVIIAKLATYLLAGAGYGLVCFAVTVAVAVPWLATRGITVGIAAVTANTLGGVVAAVAIFALVGVGLGALLRNQVATVTVLLIYLFVVEPTITRIPTLGDWTTYLPGAAGNALTQVSQANLDLLAPWAGGLVLAGYGMAFALAATLFTIGRDIT